MLDNDTLADIIQGCIAQKRDSQKTLYTTFYGYAMAICLRYASCSDDAMEIVNDGFFKLFKEIHVFSPHYENHHLALKGWIKQLMIFSAIDHFRKNNKHQHKGLSDNEESAVFMCTEAKLTFDELRKIIQSLSPAYRTVFNLYVIDGFSHEEIARQLAISVGTSKSNLHKAKARLRKMLSHLDTEIYGRRII